MDRVSWWKDDEGLVMVEVGSAVLEAELEVPEGATGLVLFAHGSGSGRNSPRNQQVARELRAGRLATLLPDLLTRAEQIEDARTNRLRFDVDLLAERLAGVTEWVGRHLETAHLPIGYFGASTGSAAALAAAAQLPERVGAIVSRGGRPDLAKEYLADVRAPTLFIVGSEDLLVANFNQAALSRMAVESRLQIIPGAGHLFEEPGAMQQVSRLARDWFLRHLKAAEPAP